MRSITEVQVSTSCDGCSDACCSQPYDWVYLTNQEIADLSDASGLAASDFVTVKVNPATSFRFQVLELPCPFYEKSTGRCAVYAHRPLVCRLYPLYVDPLSGDGMLLAAQCDSRLTVSETLTGTSWSLDKYAVPIRAWVRTLWSEARNESTK